MNRNGLLGKTIISSCPNFLNIERLLKECSVYTYSCILSYLNLHTKNVSISKAATYLQYHIILTFIHIKLYLRLIKEATLVN